MGGREGEGGRWRVTSINRRDSYKYTLHHLAPRASPVSVRDPFDRGNETHEVVGEGTEVTTQQLSSVLTGLTEVGVLVFRGLCLWFFVILFFFRVTSRTAALIILSGERWKMEGER